MYEKTTSNKSKPIIVSALVCVAFLVAMLFWLARPSVASIQTEDHTHEITQAPSLLTHEQYMEDMHYMFDVLRASFPYFGVAYRVLGVDAEYLMANTASFLEQATILNRQHFVNHMQNHFVRYLRPLGHLAFLDVHGYHMRVVSYGGIATSDPYIYWSFGPWLEIFNHPEARVFYGDPTISMRGSDAFSSEGAAVTRIISDDRIAYLGISTFNHLNMERDAETIRNFLREVSHFEHLIIDITGNTGGNSAFLSDLVMAYLIEEPLEHHGYWFFKDSYYTDFFFGDVVNHEGALEINLNDDFFTRFPNINQYDVSSFDFYIRRTLTIYPACDHIGFDGKVWLLIDGRNFSAAGVAAGMVRYTNFATLVGETTRSGGGNSPNPVYIVLPNTGAILRFALAYIVDYAGRNLYEFGVEPHHFNRPGMSAFDTVLALIAEGAY